VAFAQNVQVVTGRSSDDPVFQERWERALQTLAGMLASGAAKDGSAQSNGRSSKRGVNRTDGDEFAN
jgi:hypothetical protein